MKECWVKKKLGEVAQFVGGGTPAKNITRFYSGDIPWATVKDMKGCSLSDTEMHITPEAIEKSSTHILKNGTVVIATRVGLGKISILEKDMAINQDLKGVILNAQINKRFFFFWYLSIAQYIIDSGKGATVKGVTLPFVQNLDFKYPSFTEQQRIVEKLDAGFAKIEQIKVNSEKNLQQAKDLLEKVIKRQLYFNPNYKKIKMGDICNLYQGLAINSKTKHLLVEHSSLPLLRIKDLKEKTCGMFVKEEGYPPSCLAHENDIIYTRTGTLGYVFTGRYGIMHNNCFKIKINEHEILKKYFMYYINNDTFRNNITKLAQRAAQPDITHKLFKDQDIAYPVSLAEQQKIVDKLDKLSDICKKLEDNYNRVLTECDALKQALLSKAFNGEL